MGIATAIISILILDWISDMLLHCNQINTECKLSSGNIPLKIFFYVTKQSPYVGMASGSH